MLPLTPPKLGRYEIVDEIGKGAMGVVYLARDPLIGRLVALKTFRIGYSIKDQEMEQFRIRFMREAQSAGILSHPNIVTIHDVVEQTAEGMAFIAMEYVRGTNLKAMLQSDQPMSLSFVVDILSQVAEALDYAHAHRVIHRDVKPANILITAENRVKITDFGIARLDTSNLTQEGQLLGTPNYMAPEQIQGKEVDYRADLFALGVVLYEMLTRHKPFQGENLTVVSHRIVYDHFTPLREYTGELPPGVDRILDRALEKDPARRYQRAKDMLEDLRRVLAEISSRDDLNETLSIATWAPGASAAAADGGGTTAGTATASTGGAAAGPAGSPAKAAPARPKGAAGRPPARRLASTAAVAALLSILAAAALLFGISWSSRGEIAIDPASDARRARYAALMREGQAGMQSSDFKGAAEAFTRAWSLAPEEDRGRLELLVTTARQRHDEHMATLGREEQLAARFADAESALRDRRYSDAIVAAAAVLALDSGNADALRIHQTAEQGLARLGTRRGAAAPGPSSSAAEGRADAAPETRSPAEQEAAEPAGPARARLVVSAAVSELTVRIQHKDTLLFQETFKGQRTGLLRREDSISQARRFELPRPGELELRILVTHSNRAAQTVTRQADFPAGDTRDLVVQVSESGEVRVDVH